MSNNPEVPIFEISPQDPHWDREAACSGEEHKQFYARSVLGDDPKDITNRLCRECPVAEDCLVEAVALEDLTTQIIAGTTRKERLPLVRQYRRVRREQAKEKPNSNVNLDGVLAVIAEHIQKLRAGEKIHPHNGNTVHDPRWQGKYSKRPSVDPDRVQQFLEDFASRQ